MTYTHLLVERSGPACTITFNRPAALNALNAETIGELSSVLDDVAADAAVRVVIFTGAGEKAFVAGADIKELAQQTPISGREMARRGQQVFLRLERLGKPTIAAINGFALGGGCELALACTFRIAADTAKLGQPEINLGIIPGYGGSQRLARLIGPDRALDLILTGRMVTADEAFRLGFVTRVVPAASLAEDVQKFAGALAGKAPLAVRYALAAVNDGLDLTLPQGCEHEATLFGLVSSTDDMREGTRAFVEKRKAEFKGQ